MKNLFIVVLISVFFNIFLVTISYSEDNLNSEELVSREVGVAFHREIEMEIVPKLVGGEIKEWYGPQRIKLLSYSFLPYPKVLYEIHLYRYTFSKKESLLVKEVLKSNYLKSDIYTIITGGLLFILVIASFLMIFKREQISFLKVGIFYLMSMFIGLILGYYAGIMITCAILFTVGLITQDFIFNLVGEGVDIGFMHSDYFTVPEYTSAVITITGCIFILSASLFANIFSVGSSLIFMNIIFMKAVGEIVAVLIAVFIISFLLSSIFNYFYRKNKFGYYGNRR